MPQPPLKSPRWSEPPDGAWPAPPEKAARWDDAPVDAAASAWQPAPGFNAHQSQQMAPLLQQHGPGVFVTNSAPGAMNPNAAPDYMSAVAVDDATGSSAASSRSFMNPERAARLSVGAAASVRADAFAGAPAQQLAPHPTYSHAVPPPQSQYLQQQQQQQRQQYQQQQQPTSSLLHRPPHFPPQLAIGHFQAPPQQQHWSR